VAEVVSQGGLRPDMMNLRTLNGQLYTAERSKFWSPANRKQRKTFRNQQISMELETVWTELFAKTKHPCSPTDEWWWKLAYNEYANIITVSTGQVEFVPTNWEFI